MEQYTEDVRQLQAGSSASSYWREGWEPFGLSLAHISPLPRSWETAAYREAMGDEAHKPPTVSIALGGKLVKVKSNVRLPQFGGGKRGRCSGLSRQGGKRLMDRLNSINWDRVKQDGGGLFVDLTYPGKEGQWEHFTPEDCSRHRQRFIQRLERVYPEVSWFWVKEFQERGAPHFHLLVFGVRFIPHQWVAQHWYEVVGSGDLEHRRAGTKVGKVRSQKQAIGYLAKYLSKGAEFTPDGYTGRMWSCSRELPSEVIDIIMDLPQFFTFRRQLQKWAAKQGFKRGTTRYQTFTAYLNHLDGLRLVGWVNGT